MSATPNTGVVFTTEGEGDVINPGLGFDVITVPYINPNDPNNIGQFNAEMAIGCSCTSTTPTAPPLDVAHHPYKPVCVLFRQKIIQQLAATGLDGSICQRSPIASLQNGISFHVVEDNIWDRQLKGSYENPSETHDRLPLRGLGSSSSGVWLNDIYARGWEHIYGDTPGYKNGRQITFESGKIKRGILDNTIYQQINLTWQQQTDANGELYTVINGVQGYYIRDITIHFAANDDKTERRFHLIFRFNAPSADCIEDTFRSQATVDQETVIDNIGSNMAYQTDTSTPPTSGTPSDVQQQENQSGYYVFVDTRYSSADFLELRGFWQPEITKITANALLPEDYFDNVLVGNDFASAFDNRGRLFVFYEDPISYTELPYVSIHCGLSSTSAAQASSSSSSLPSIPGGVTITGDGNAGGGGAGGGGGGGGGIPGNAPQPITYSIGSSSSSSPAASSSSATPPPVLPSSSSSSSSLPQPPPAVTNASAAPVYDDQGDPTVQIQWQPPIAPTTSQTVGPVTYTIIWSAGNIDGPYTTIATGLDSPNFNQTVGGPDGAVLGEWNYYKIYAVDQYGQLSPYILIQMFLVLPKTCYGRDCLGCVTQGHTARNSFTVTFSQPTTFQMAFECDACEGQEGQSFITILQDAFYSSQLSTLQVGSADTTAGNLVPLQFCLLQNCNDDVANQCIWTNTFYIPAMTNGCLGFGCVSGFQKILIPLTITLTQSSAGWRLTATAMGPDCKYLEIFDSGVTGTACIPPTDFLSILPNASPTTTGQLGNATTAANTLTPCAVYPPVEYSQHTGTISCAMSPDLGLTWYEFKGIIQINYDRQAIRPTVSYDPKTDNFHLFFIDRDYVNDMNQLLIQGFANGINGFDAFVRHVSFAATWFNEGDAFIPMYPAPGTTYIPPIGATSSSSSTYSSENPYYIPILQQFSIYGQMIRSANQVMLFHEQASGSTPVSITQEQHHTYISNEGRLYYVRFGQSGTLVDPPDRLTRLRRASASCGAMTWTVSGITDPDCTCQALLGSADLVLDNTTANYTSSDWTLTVSTDYNYWVMNSNNGMMSFQMPRNLTQCPPTGTYQLVCIRCEGSVVGTLDTQSLSISGENEGAIDNGNFPPQFSNLTDFGPVQIPGHVDNNFVATNTESNTVNFTNSPAVVITGGNAGDFTIVQDLPSSIDPYETAVFTIRFTPSISGTETATVNIASDAANENPYVFNIQGEGVSIPTPGASSSSSVQQVASGTVQAADSVGQVYSSNDGGVTWNSIIQDIKTGQYATLAYDRRTDELFCLYITASGMLLARKYPALLYTNLADQPTQLSPTWDGLNIVQPPEEVLPDENTFLNEGIGDATGGGLGDALGGLTAFSTYFGLPNISTPGDVLSAAEADYVSKKTALVNELDPEGLPIYLVGTLQGSLINGQYSYPNSYIFNNDTWVGSAKPAAYISKTGRLRFFYADINGNVNAGYLLADQATMDTKRPPNLEI